MGVLWVKCGVWCLGLSLRILKITILKVKVTLFKIKIESFWLPVHFLDMGGFFEIEPNF